MTVWKLGCRWGRGKPPCFFEYLLNKSIVIGEDHKEYSFNDIILLTDGFSAIGVAKVLSGPRFVTDTISLDSEFEKFEIPYDNTVFTYNAKIYKLDTQDQFQYKTQQGIIRIHKDNIRNEVIKLIEKYDGESSMKEMVDTLKKKRQIIIQGAPGVGKTYVTKELALRIIGQTIPESREELNRKYSEAVDHGQIEFCTFHQSMDYEDFVEGYKPDLGMTGAPVFVLRDGPFKQICRRCLGGEDESAFEEAPRPHWGLDSVAVSWACCILRWCRNGSNGSSISPSCSPVPRYAISCT
jgi:5-methylcytosine-specific restriction protein B